jgi:PAS domain S-box-containing protein
MDDHEQDISDHSVEVQQALLHYQQLFDFSPDAYVATDRSGIIQEANYAAADFFGLSREFLIKKPLLFFIADSDRRLFVEKLNLFNHEADTPWRWELTFQPRGAQPIYATVTLRAAPSADSHHLRWSFRDITRRRQAEEMLRAEKELADTLIDLAEALIIAVDRSGRILRINQFACSLLGYKALDLQNRSLSEVLTQQQFSKELLGGLAVDKPFVRGIHILQTRDRRTRTISWSAKLVTAGQKEAAWALVVGHDITELQEAQDRAMRSERLAAIGQMVTGLAHESRNALQRSVACLEILRFRLQDQPEMLDLLTRVQRAQDDLQHLYESVREYAAPIKLEIQPCYLPQIWREAWDMLRSVWAGRNVEFREQIDVTDPQCEVSPFHLKQVFRNLLENAVAAAKDPVQITVRCSQTLIDSQKGYQIAVKDNGPGFTEEQRQKAFDPFFTTKLQGTGLGLAICKRLVEAHGGNIALPPVEQPGAVVLLTLPRRKA